MKRIATVLFAAGLAGAAVAAFPGAATAAVSVGVGVSPAGVSAGISVSTAPPPLPADTQPFAPGPGYVWTPGYWGWAPAGYYYWVGGAWMMPPSPGLLWTPGWWGWSGNLYHWHPGYWGFEVGFYGGINYGYGYFGTGYGGGYWLNNRFYYNTAVSRVNVKLIHNTYVDKTVIHRGPVSRVSYNGGHGGVAAHADARQRAFEHQRRVPPTAAQTGRRDQAMRDPARRYEAGHGRFSAKPAGPAARSAQPARGVDSVTHTARGVDHAIRPGARSDAAGPRRGTPAGERPQAHPGTGRQAMTVGTSRPGAQRAPSPAVRPAAPAPRPRGDAPQARRATPPPDRPAMAHDRSRSVPRGGAAPGRGFTSYRTPAPRAGGEAPRFQPRAARADAGPAHREFRASSGPRMNAQRGGRGGFGRGGGERGHW